MRQKPWLTYAIDFSLYDFPKFEEQKYILFFAKFDLPFKGSTSGLKSQMDLLSLAILAGHCETGVHADDYPLNLCAKNGAEK